MGFRETIRAWIEDNAPIGLRDTVTTPFRGHWGGTDAAFDNDDYRVWFERCVALGYTAPTWPKELGGGGLSGAEGRIWTEELSRLGLPMPLVGFGLTMIGPILLAHGTDAQKAEHVPAIAKGQIRWCQGYSEPGAGSDLASLRCRAERDGDDFIVNGQKIWTSHADKADWIFCLVRTSSDGPKQVGITFLLMPMDSQGITVRPIELISGASPFCEVFFEDVRVPASNVVGTIGDGWKVAKALLAHERGMVGESVAAGGARPDVLNPYTLQNHAIEVVGLDDDGVLADPDLRRQLVDQQMREQVMRLTLRRSNDAVRAGAAPGPESSIFKVVGTELNQVRWELALQIGGLDTLIWEGGTDRDEALGKHWLRSRGNTIEGGTSEIQRNIIARRVLGLPK